MWASTLQAALPAVLLGGLLMAASAAHASGVPRTLAEGEVTLERLKEIYTAAFLRVEVDEDGDLRIEEDGIKTFVRVDTKRRLVTYFAAWRLKDSVPRARKLQWVNDLNRELVLVRFTVPQTPNLICDYQFFYEGGISSQSLIHHYRQFVNVARGAVTLKDPDKIVGTDPTPPVPTSGGI